MIFFKAELVFFEDLSVGNERPHVRRLRFAPSKAAQTEDARGFADHLPGQYALLKFDEFAWRPYSVANTPNGHMLEFHIRAGHSGPSHYATHDIEIGEIIEIQGFAGDCYFQGDCNRPIILIAGGTGLAPMLAIAEAALAHDPHRHITLYYGGRHMADLYAHHLLIKLQQDFPCFQYYPVLTHPQELKPDEPKRGEPEIELLMSPLIGTVSEVAFAHAPHLSESRVYASGPVEMLRHSYHLAENLAAQAKFNMAQYHSDLSAFDLRTSS